MFKVIALCVLTAAGMNQVALADGTPTVPGEETFMICHATTSDWVDSLKLGRLKGVDHSNHSNGKYYYYEFLDIQRKNNRTPLSMDARFQGNGQNLFQRSWKNEAITSFRNISFTEGGVKSYLRAVILDADASGKSQMLLELTRESGEQMPTSFLICETKP